MAAFLFLITDDTDIYTIIIHYLCSPKSYKSETEVISVEGLSVEFNATPLFADVSYVINKKDRIALVGKNGAGKSTMLKILAGLQNPTRGVVAVPKDVTIGYLPQVMILSDVRTVMEEAELAFEHIFELQANLERMNQQLADRTDYESEEYHQLIDRFTHENDRFLMMGGTNFQAEIERTLLGLGFSREDFNRSTSEFSGGWRMRIELAKLLLRRPDVLLLDEPTNHLDMRTKDVLKQAIRDFNGTVILVSHDREFLDGLVSKVYEFGGGQVREHLGGIYDFLESRKLDSLRELEQRATVSKTEKDGNISKDSASPAKSEDPKLSYGEQKEFARRLRKAEKVVADIESEIAGLEKRIAEVEEKLATPDGAADTSLYELHGQLKKQLDDYFVSLQLIPEDEVLDKLQK